MRATGLLFSVLLVLAVFAPAQGQVLTLDHVDGLYAPDTIATGQLVTFYVRMTSDAETYDGICNGFRVYSPDGAQWGTTVPDTLPLGWKTWFDLVFAINTFSIDGLGADTVGFAGSKLFAAGLPAYFDQVSYKITIGPIDDAYHGTTIVLDSSFYPPSGVWKWAGPTVYPDWGGPYEFTVYNPDAPPPPELVLTPTVLNFTAQEGGANPASQTFNVSTVNGEAISFNASESLGWVALTNASGTTPADVTVNVSVVGLVAGNYTGQVKVSAGAAANTPQYVTVNLVVEAAPVEQGPMITLDHVDGLWAPDTIHAGELVTFYLRLQSDTATYDGICNGFRIYSPDGASWGTTVPDTLPLGWKTWFDLVFAINSFSIDGMGADTVGFAGSKMFANGLPAYFDEVAYTITIGPIDPIYHGTTIVLDSSFYPPAGIWKWAGPTVYPDWGGPYEFTVYSENAPEPAELVVTPATLDFTAQEGGTDPAGQIFTVSTVGGEAISYTASETLSWLSLLNATGTTPGDVTVNVSVAGLPAGNYTGQVKVSSSLAANSPQYVTVNLAVEAAPLEPEPMLLLDHVDGLYAPDTILAGQPITFYIRMMSDSATYDGICNGFRVYSPDGAQWGSTVADTMPLGWKTWFDLVFAINTFSMDGMGADTMGFAGSKMFAPGLPAFFNEVAYKVTIGPIDPIYHRTTIVLDSSFYPPSGVWKWAGPTVYPKWGGPYEFTVFDPTAPAPPTLVVTPSTLNFTAAAGGAAPAAQTFAVTTEGGEAISYNASETSDWITLTNATGTTPGTVIVNVSPAGLAAGNYSATVRVSASAADNSPQYVTVNFTVTAPPSFIVLTPTSLNFSAVAGVNPESQTFTITEAWGNVISVTASESASWITLNKTKSTVTGNTPLTVTVNVKIQGLVDGVYRDSIMVTSDGAANSPKYLPVTLYVGTPPKLLVVTPTELNFQATQGAVNPATQSFSVTELNAFEIPFAASEASSWITLTNASGMTPGTVTVGVLVSGLAPGTYLDSVMVSSTEADNSPQYVKINFQVDPIAGDNPILTLDHVDGLYEPGVILAGQEVSFYIRIKSNNSTYDGICNGFRVYSPDGAEWGTTVADTLPLGWKTWFDLVFSINKFSIDGMGADTVGFAGSKMYSTGLPANFDEVSYKITIGPIDPSFDGTTIVLDSSFYPPAGVWKWAGPTLIPDWGGPYTFTVYNPGPPPTNLVMAPTALNFVADEGGADPAAQTFTINTSDGAVIPFEATETSSWMTLTDASGTTPGTVGVAVSTTGLAAGLYTDSIMISSAEADNSPAFLVVTFSVQSEIKTLVVTPTTLNFAVNQGDPDPAAQTFSVTEITGANIDYTATETAAWINLTNAVGTTPGTVSVAVVSAGLAPGTYQHVIEVASTTADNGPLYVTVNLTVEEVVIVDNPLITLDHVDGLLEPGVIKAGEVVTFYIRMTSIDDTFDGICNGFRIYSPDGATWGTTVPDTLPLGWKTWFDLVFSINKFSIDGMGADTVGFAGSKLMSTGLPANFDRVSYTIKIGPIDESYVGKTIVLDSSYYPPAGVWKWAGPTVYPDWGGPYVFTVGEEVAAPELVVAPAELNFAADEGGADPASQTFTVSTVAGEAIAFDAAGTASWMTLTNASGTTPGTVTVAVSTAGLTGGLYRDSIIVSAPDAGNTPQIVYVNFSVQTVIKTLVVAPTTLNFTVMAGDPDPAAQTFNVTELTGANIDYTATETAGWINLTNAVGTTPGTVSVAVVNAGLTAGTYQHVIEVASTTADNGPLYVTVNLTVTPMVRTLVVAPTTLDFVMTDGDPDPAAQTFSVTEIAGHSIDYTATEAAAWINLTNAVGTTPGTVSVAVVSAGLAPGTYQHVIEVASTTADNGPLYVTVNLTIEEVVIVDNPLITLDHVDGLLEPGVIKAGEVVTFYIRMTSIDDTFDGICNGFRVYSPDGATWGTTVPDTLPLGWKTWFDLVFSINKFSIDGMGADTVGFAGSKLMSTGLPANFDQVSYTIKIGPIDESYVGKTIVLDSSYYPPAGVWKWAGPTVYPDWGGPYVFTVGQEVPPPVLAVAPTALNFATDEGGPDPASQTFTVSTVAGEAIAFAASETASWMTLTNASGTTPGTVTVTVSAAGLDAGLYVDSVMVSAGDASNSPVWVVVNFSVQDVIKTLVVAPTTLNFTVMAGDPDPAAQTFNVTELTGANIDYTATETASWINLTNAVGTTPGTVSVAVVNAGLTAGTYQHVIEVASTTADNGPLYVTVNLTVTPMVRTLVVAPTTLDFVVTEGDPDPAAQTFSVTEIAGHSTDYTATETADWLTLTNATGMTPATVTVAALTSGLAPGTYQHNIAVASTVADNSPLYVTVNLTVEERPALEPPYIVLDHVDGLYADGQLTAGQMITFYLRITSDVETYDGICNGFRIYSPDGATWGTTVPDTLPLGWRTWFDLVFSINKFSIDGMGADTVGFAGSKLMSTGLPSYFDQVAYKITIGPIDESYHGKTIVLDSSFYPPTGVWKWAGPTVYPSWGGPYAFTVVDPNHAELVVAPSVLNFSAVEGGTNPATQTISVTEAEGLSIAYQATTAAGWIKLTNAVGTTPGAVTVGVDMAGLAPGSYSNTVVITGAATNSPQYVTVNFEIQSVPKYLEVAPTVLNFSATELGANPASQTFTVSETGGFHIAYTASETAGWITLANASGTTPGVVTVNVSIAGLTPGTYQQTIDVASADADNSPQYVTVNLEVLLAPKTLVVTPTELNFYATLGEGNPAAQTISVTELKNYIIDYTATETATWMSLTGATGTTPGTVTVNVDVAGMAVGNYSAAIDVSSPDDAVVHHVAVSLVIEPSLPPAAYVDPYEMHIFWMAAEPPMMGHVYFGNLSGGYTVGDINLSSITINGTVHPVSTTILPSMEGFVGEVMDIEFPIYDFLDTYRPVFDSTTHTFTVAGSFTDAGSFAIDGEVFIYGHLFMDIDLNDMANIADMVFLVEWMFNFGPAPLLYETADADQNGEVRIDDLIIFVDYMFGTTPTLSSDNEPNAPAKMK